MNEVRRLGHEQVSLFQDPATGTAAIIAVHSTALGPALGGCRMRDYATIDAAFSEVLRLSEAMTYKNAIADISFGGGKAVILGDSVKNVSRREVFLCFGRWVSSLSGSYITAEDMNVSVGDIETVVEVCPHVAGRDLSRGGGGDPSPYTARGVFGGIRACLVRCFDSPSFEGREVAVQGLGHVGRELVTLLTEAGAEVIVADTRDENVREVCERHGARGVSVDKLHTVRCDVFAPCAIGGTVNPKTVPELACRVVAGAANNQLADDRTEQLLVDRDILYAPDFVINAGGVILCAAEFEPGGFSADWANKRVDQIEHTLGSILDDAKKEGELPEAVALKLAEERIAAKGREG